MFFQFQINGALGQAQDTLSNSSVIFELIWDGDNPDEKEDLTRTENDERDEIENTEQDEALAEPFAENGEIDDEIQSIEDEVDEIEMSNFLEDSKYETEAEKEIKTKTKEILDLMATIQEENNAIIR